MSASLLRGGSVVDVRAGATRRADVLVRDGRVEGVGEDLPQDGASVVDCAGRFLMPGLIDCHVHPGMTADGLRTDPDGLSADRVQRDLDVWLRCGVTTVQAMGTDRAFAFELQRRQRQGAAGGARLLTVGHGFGVPEGVPLFRMDPPGPLRLSEPAALTAALEDLARNGASGAKLWYDDSYGQFPKMAREVATHIIATCRRLGLRSYAHVYRVDDAKWLVGQGLDVLAHMPRDRRADDELAALMKERDAAVVPTLTVPHSNIAYLDAPAFVAEPLFARFLPEGSREHVRSEAFLETIRAKAEFPHLRDDLSNALANVGVLHGAGARFGFGTDAGVANRIVGFAAHHELELLVSAGVSAAEALRMATLGAASVLGRRHLGEIAPGKLADILVLRADPLLDVRGTRAIDAVWLDGAPARGAL